MKKISIKFICLLLIFTSLNAITSYEKTNNCLLMKAVNILRAAKKEHINLGLIEAQYKQNIEKDIDYQIKHLTKNLRTLLGNFNNSFSRLKTKLTLIKSHVKNLSENPIEQDILFVVLGLKPISLIYYENKELVNLINKHFPNELSAGIFWEKGEQWERQSLFREKPHLEKRYYIINHHPIFYINFVKASYPTSKETPGFLKELDQILKTYAKKKQAKFIEYQWNHNRKLPSDNLAYVLGLCPTWISKTNAADEVKAISNPAHSYNFRILNIPGVVGRDDRTPYVQLYVKLAEYIEISLYGIKSYIRQINTKLQHQVFYGGEYMDNNYSDIHNVLKGILKQTLPRDVNNS